jgi:hypothetical protein
MGVTWQTLKKWGGKKGFGISDFGEGKAELTKKLVKYMKANMDDLDEDQLEWLEEQTGGKVKAKAKPKRKRKAEPKAKAEPKRRRKRKPKAEEEEEVAEEKPKRKKRRKKKEEEEEAVLVKAGEKELRSFAKELDISTKGYTKWSGNDWETLANNIYAEVDDMDDEDREELSKDLFEFYTTIKGQQEEEPPEEEEAVEVDIPKKIQIKRWTELLGIKKTGKDEEELAREILEEYKELDDEDKEDLPDSLIEWGDKQLGVEPEEVEVEEERAVLPDYKTLKGFAKEVGFTLRDIKKADKHPPTIVEMIVEAYDKDDEDEYSEGLVKLVASMAPVEKEEVVEEEPDTSELIGWLVEAGYDEDDIEDWNIDQLTAKLIEDYKDEDDREDLPEESIEYLKEAAPELFEKKKPKKKKKVKK